MRHAVFLLMLLIGSLFLKGEPSPKRELDPGFEVFRDRCMACHLQTGLGIQAMNAPSIAGLPRWYVADQLRKFRRDQRGFHADDAPGKLMQANALVLDERAIAFVGRHIESLPHNQQRNTGENAALENSEALYQDHCARCHGERGEGMRAQRVPPLTSQQDWYLLKQMDNFAEEKRDHAGYLPAASIDEKALKGIIAWVTELSVEKDG